MLRPNFPVGTAPVVTPQPPVWMPTQGTIGNINTNTLYSVLASGGWWDASPLAPINRKFDFSGYAHVRDDGLYGTINFSGGGHAAAQDPRRYLYNIFDRTWRQGDNFNNFTPSGWNAPLNEWTEFVGNNGWPVSSHTYQHEFELTAADGGGLKGSMVLIGMYASNGTGGGTTGSHIYDHSTLTYSRFSTGLANGTAGQGRMGCWDSLRKKFWTTYGSGDNVCSLPTLPIGNPHVWESYDTFPSLVLPNGNWTTASNNTGFYVARHDMFCVWVIMTLNGTTLPELYGIKLVDVIAGTGRWHFLAQTGDVPPVTTLAPSTCYRPDKDYHAVFNSYSQQYGELDNFIRYMDSPPLGPDPYVGNWNFTRETFTGTPARGDGLGFNKMAWVNQNGFKAYVWAPDTDGPVQAWVPVD